MAFGKWVRVHGLSTDASINKTSNILSPSPTHSIHWSSNTLDMNTMAVLSRLIKLFCMHFPAFKGKIIMNVSNQITVTEQNYTVGNAQKKTKY